MVKSNRQLGFLLLFVARLRFGHVTNHFGVLGHENFSTLGLHVHGHLGDNLITRLGLFGVDSLRQLHRDDAAGSDSSSMRGLRLATTHGSLPALRRSGLRLRLGSARIGRRWIGALR